jgi:hypothetical protein
MKPSEMATGLILSTALHLCVALGAWQTLEMPVPDKGHAPPTAFGKVPEARSATEGTVPAGRSATRMAPPRDEGPLEWLYPVFAPGAFGPKIDVGAGRILKVTDMTAPVLKKPRFRPYSPPKIRSALPDPGQDILNRTRPLTSTWQALEQAEADLRQTVAADLADCRLDDIPLDTVILRARYIRLQKVLFRKGLSPDFSYADMRNHFRQKLHRIRRALDGVPPEQYFDALLFHYRKDKIYEEKRGHALFNAIFYDIYNCRTGTEELAMYLALFHPDLPLGINRGSIVRFDGSLVGHVDPAVRINGQWTVFPTVARSARGTAPYQVGELFPIEKLVLDYLPGFDAGACGLNRPLARNGEELNTPPGSGNDNHHPLIVRHDDSRIVLLRETAPQPETFAMVSREERLFNEMLGRYRGTGRKTALLHPDHPYLDFIFHLQGAAARDRKDLVHLYLKNRIDTTPADPKRPLRIPEYLPGHQDLVRTLFSPDPDPDIEVLPGIVVPAARYRPHRDYIETHNRVIENLTARRPALRKPPLPEAIARFLLYYDGRGTTLIRPPAYAPRALVRDLVDDRYDMSPFMQNEPLRRENGTSWRRVAILKAGLAGDTRWALSALEKRIALLKTTLAHGTVILPNAKDRAGNEITGSITYDETLRQQGKTGLSPGFIKDMVELMGEGPALAALGSYLHSPELRLGRRALLEIFGYMGRYCLLEKSRNRLVELARERFALPTDPAIRTAAAQYLARTGTISAEAANRAYFSYLRTTSADAVTVGALLAAGLDRTRAAAHFRQKIERTDPNAAGAHQRLDRLDRIAKILDDPAASDRIAGKHVAVILEYFRTARHHPDGADPNPSGALNSLSHLAREGIEADPVIFNRFVDAGANDPTVLLMGDLVRHWLGPNRFREGLDEAMALEHDRLAAGMADIEALGRATRRIQAQGGPAAYGAALAALRDSAARITFLAALHFQNGFRNDAYSHQRALLHRLFSLDAFERKFANRGSAALAVERDRALNHDAIHRAVELAGYFFKAMKKPGAFDLNHAPFIRPTGDYRATCGPTRKAVNSRSAPKYIAFTAANAYFTSLLDPGNSPEKVAAAFGKEQELLRSLSQKPPSPERAADLNETQLFFNGMAASAPCDVRRIYLFEKLLRQSALPERLPDWVLALARESHHQERDFLERMQRAGGAAAVLEAHRRMDRAAFEQSWGERPFSIRHLYATLLLVKTGHLAVDDTGAFVPTEKFNAG